MKEWEPSRMHESWGLGRGHEAQPGEPRELLSPTALQTDDLQTHACTPVPIPDPPPPPRHFPLIKVHLDLYTQNRPVLYKMVGLKSG